MSKTAMAKLADGVLRARTLDLVRDATNCMVDMSRLINDACANVMAIMKDQR